MLRKMKGQRKLIKEDQEWGYKIGRTHSVIVKPDGKKIAVPLDKLLGMPLYAIERGISITPADVRYYIDTNLIG